MVDISQERHIHMSQAEEFAGVYHDPYMVWSENHIIKNISGGDIVVQYYRKGKGTYFIFGRSCGPSFSHMRPVCSFDRHGSYGRAISIIDINGPHRIRGDILDYVDSYIDKLSCGDCVDILVEHDDTNRVRSFISIVGKSDIWEAKPGLYIIQEELEKNS